MKSYEKEILKIVKFDLDCMNINLKLDDNKYHYNLIKGNIKDLLRAETTKDKFTISELKTLKRAMDCLVILEQDTVNYTKIYNKLI